ncbi:MAG: Holliday junction endonuclease [candidate division Zixibacteria bacterium]|nr:Holliday junction endonuclease [candidate division Zixibacteria bacterium]
MKAIAGIDPGLDGGICVLVDKTISILMPMPTNTITVGRKKKRELDLPAICQAIDHVSAAIVEKVHSMPSQGVASTFKFGTGYGMLLGILAAQGTPYTLVSPQTWKKVMLRDMPKGKGSSILRAKQLCPDIKLLATERSRKPHDGMAEAYLLARYGILYQYNEEM